MKVIIGSFQQESNSFSPIECGIDMFKKRMLVYGEDVIKSYEGTSTQIGAFLNVLNQEKAEIIPSISAGSVASGPVTEEAYQEVESTLIKDIKANWPVDGVLLCLHGATILTEYYDGVGRLLERIRQVVGDKVTIACTLDFHANVTEKMITSTDILIGYHTYPHVDQYDIGYDVASLLVKTIKSEIKPIMAMCKLPMIHQAEACRTDEYPFKKIMDNARKVDSRKGVLSASIFQMQPWMDLEDAGASVIIIADGSKNIASTFAKSLAKEYWDIKEELNFKLTPLEEAIDRAAKIEEGPVVISDSADSPSAGSPGDSPVVLAYLLNNNIDIVTFITIVDAETVEKAIEIGVSKEGEFYLGGKITKNSKPVKVNGTVKLISDGEYLTQRHPKAKIKKRNMGRTAVIKTGKIFIVVMENSASITDPYLFRSVGLEPKNARLVVVKSALQFREDFEDIAKEIYLVDTPGASSSNLQEMPFKNLRKPIYPFDDIQSYDIQVNALGHIKG